MADIVGRSSTRTRRHLLSLLGGSALATAVSLLAGCGAGTAPAASAVTAAPATQAPSASTATRSPTVAPTVVAKTTSAATPTPVPPPKSVGKGTLVFQTPGVGAEDTAFAPSAIKFSQETGIKVEYVDAGLSFEKYAVQYASDTGGDAMFLSGPYSIPGLRQSAKVPWSLGAMPRGKAGVWTRDPANCYTIWTGSKNKDQAFQFLEFLTGPEGQLILGQSARGIPARKSIATSKAFLEQSDVNWQVFVDAIPHDGVQAVTDVWPDMDSTIGKMINPMWNNRITVDAFVTQLNPVIQALLDKAKVRRDLSGTYLPVGWKEPSL